MTLPTTVTLGGKRRRSSTVEPSSVSRRSKRPAQSDDASSGASSRAASRALERPHEHGQLEVDGRDAFGRGLDAARMSTGRHSTSSPAPGPRYQDRPRPGRPRAPAGSGRAGPPGRPTPSRRGRPRAAAPPRARRASQAGPPPPALEQAAEGERRRLTGAQLDDQPPCGQLAGRVADEDVRPGARSAPRAAKPAPPLLVGSVKPPPPRPR